VGSEALVSVTVAANDRDVHFDDLVTLAETVSDYLDGGQIYGILNFDHFEAQFTFFVSQFRRVISIGFQHDCFLSHISPLNPSTSRPACTISTWRASHREDTENTSQVTLSLHQKFLLPRKAFA